MLPLDPIASFSGFFATEWVLSIGAMVLLFLCFRKSSPEASTSGVSSAIILILAFMALISGLGVASSRIFDGLLVFDLFGVFFKGLIILTALVSVLMISKSTELAGANKPEFYFFLMVATFGLCLLSVASHLLMVYLALEIASIVSYIMAGYLANNARSEEAGLKYVLYGGVASGIMIFGMSLLYGLTGTLDFFELRAFFETHATDRVVLFITFIFILTGLGYKMAIAPFHMWSPDVYEGAPLPVTAFLSVASKAAGFAVTLRLFFTAFVVTESNTWQALKMLDWQFLVAVLSALSMTVGNVLALKQSNLKRLLAYSSVSHAGYALLGLVAMSPRGVEATLYYFAVYFLMNFGAFLVLYLVLQKTGNEELTTYKGLAKSSPYGLFLSISFGIFLFSLAGLPPFAGFVAKWKVFMALMANGQFMWLAIVGALNSVVALYYYVKIAKTMFIDSASENAFAPIHTHFRFTSLVAIFACLNIVLGLFFNNFSLYVSRLGVLLR